MEPTIYKPSIYNGAGIYNNGAATDTARRFGRPNYGVKFQPCLQMVVDTAGQQTNNGIEF